uniref:Uncharacterized protein n=1 Tax=Dechloromonas aromatica (strain RCB) TaxID=159087 RepID=Q47BY6_DECAR
MSHTKSKFTPGQVRATKALLRFCQEHGHAPFWIEQLKECVGALEAKKDAVVCEKYALLRRAGMGSFIDWFPRTPEGEDGQYEETLWWALDAYWLEVMQPFKNAGNA